jgi:nondiscriminating glutamyl-tRNA synthetase
MPAFGKNKVRTRFAPSPTGFLHLGNLRGALYNYLFAKHNGGDFLLRIEDTDQTRFVPGAISNIIETLKWAGMDYDEGPILNGDVMADKGGDGPYLQSRRLDIYRKHADELVAKGHAYPCFCTAERLEQMRHEQTLRKEPPMYDGRCRNLSPEEIAKNRGQKIPEVIRLKMPTDGKTTFTDLIRGEIEFENKLLDDQVIMKSDGFPTYHLAAVVDDHLMKITHVIRGEEWLPSTPKHLTLFSFFGWQPPQYAHLPLFLKPGGGKLSKRDMASSAYDYIEMGYLKEALLNFIALLGWHPVGEREKVTMEEMIAEFDLARVNKAGAVFTTEKLDWLNGQYIREMPVEKLAELCRPFLQKAGYISEGYPEKKLIEAVVLERSRIKKLSDLPSAISFIFEPVPPAKEKLCWKKQDPSDAAAKLEALAAMIDGLSEADFTAAGLEAKIKEWIAASGGSTGEILWPMRVALSGREASPGPFEIAAALGKTETSTRLSCAIKTLKS